MGDCKKQVVEFARSLVRVLGQDEGTLIHEEITRLFEGSWGESGRRLFKDKFPIIYSAYSDEFQQIKQAIKEKEGETQLVSIYVIGRMMGLSRRQVVNIIDKEAGRIAHLDMDKINEKLDEIEGLISKLKNAVDSGYEEYKLKEELASKSKEFVKIIVNEGEDVLIPEQVQESIFSEMEKEAKVLKRELKIEKGGEEEIKETSLYEKV